MTAFLSRRRLLGRAMAAAGGALLLGDADRAFAVPRSAAAAPPLPAIGQTVTVSVNAFATTLAVDLPPPLPTLNFIGSLAQKVLVGGADFVRLQTLDFTLEAFHPLFGKVTLRLPDADVSPASILQLGPGRLTETWLQAFQATFERQGDNPGPFTYQTLEPAKWVAQLAQYPPPPQGTNPDGSPTGGALFQLQAPIRLGTVSSGGAETVYGQFQDMAANQGG